MRNKDKPLINKKHELFCHEYLKDLNQTQAAIRAGYSEKSARVTASRLLTKANIIARIEQLIADRKKRLCLTNDAVIIKLFDIYEKCMQAQPVYEFDYVTKKLKPTGQYTFDSKGALRAMELIGKHQGMFVTKIETEKPFMVVIQDDIQCKN